MSEVRERDELDLMLSRVIKKLDTEAAAAAQICIRDGDWSRLGEVLSKEIRVRTATDAANVLEFLHNGALSRVNVEGRAIEIRGKLMALLNTIEVTFSEEREGPVAEEGEMSLSDAKLFLKRVSDHLMREIGRNANLMDAYPRYGEVGLKLPVGLPERWKKYEGKRVYELIYDLCQENEDRIAVAEPSNTILGSEEPEEDLDFIKYRLDRMWQNYELPPFVLEAVYEDGSHEMKLNDGADLKEEEALVFLIWQQFGVFDKRSVILARNERERPVLHGITYRAYKLRKKA